jgi:hypothetical protein
MFLRAVCAVWLAVASGVAYGYDFAVDARTIGQGYQLRWYRFSEPDRLLNRRRLTQSLGLEVWNILEPAFDPGRPDPPPLAPFDLYVSSSLRIDHDFGDYVQGDTVYATTPPQRTTQPATTAVPELAAEDVGLEILYAFVGVRGVLGVLDAELGRQLLVDNLDWYAFDGLHATARLPAHLALEAHAGLLVRDSSPLGSATQEPDGTGSAQCVAFLADTSTFIETPDCKQRQAAAPTFGVALATRGLRELSARISYRRSIAETANGLYPDTRGEAPAWGVIEEKLSASARAVLLDAAVVPYAAARWNLVVGGIDEAQVGVRLAYGDHALTPELQYSLPSFDGDSIFNVFASEPFWDARLTYDVWPGRGRLRGYARGFYRRFQNDTNGLAPGETVAASAGAAGGGLGARWSEPGRGNVRLDLFYEDGFGGLRAGGDASGRWRIGRRITIEGRASLVRFDEDSLPNLYATTFGVQAGGVVTLGPGMALHLLAEENTDRFESSQLRLLAILDLAFEPEH